MNVNEGKIVFNYLKKKHKKSDLFGLIKSDHERLAYMEYDAMSQQEREFTLKNIIISYLVDNYSDSLLFNHVTWSPDKRRYRIMEYAKNKYDTLSAEEYDIIIDSLLS